MATFVIVHGAFGGGWEWAGVARALRARGHEAFTPTLTGLGERHHLGPAVGLGTNVEDVLGLLAFEDLRDVVLCGASYGGMTVTAAADRAPDRVASIIYIDALVPRDGQCGLDLLPASFGDVVRAAAAGDGWVPIPAGVLPPEEGVAAETRARYIARLRPQPAATFLEPVALNGAVEHIPRAFVRCTTPGLDVGEDPIAPMAERARAAGWPYRELAAPHDPHLYDPDAVATLLHEIAISQGPMPG